MFEQYVEENNFFHCLKCRKSYIHFVLSVYLFFGCFVEEALERIEVRHIDYKPCRLFLSLVSIDSHFRYLNSWRCQPAVVVCTTTIGIFLWLMKSAHFYEHEHTDTRLIHVHSIGEPSS